MFRLLRHTAASLHVCPYASCARSASSTRPQLAKSMPPRPKPPPDSEIEESYLKGSGPGGQKINKTSSAVQLKHVPTGIVVKSQATRSREQNRKDARDLLAQKVDDLHNGDQSRSAIVGSVRKKRADSAAKKSRRKYRMLEEAREIEIERSTPTMTDHNMKTPNQDVEASGQPAEPRPAQIKAEKEGATDMDRQK